MIYFLDGSFDKEQTEWCKDNEIFYLTAWKALFPVVCFVPLFTKMEKLDKMLNKIIVFNATDAMAYKLRWD